MLTCLPNGILAMSADIPGLVQTSLNLGILTTTDEELCAVFSLRSSIDSQLQMLKRRLTCLMNQLGGRVEFEGEYTGWQYQEHSPLRELMVEVFQEQYGHAPKIEAIHAGLECGLFAGKIPVWTAFPSVRYAGNPYSARTYEHFFGAARLEVPC